MQANNAILHFAAGGSIMPVWKLWDYRSEGGSVPFREWYDEQEEQAQAALDATVLHLRAVDDWLNPTLRTVRDRTKKAFKKLEERHAGLCEIRFWPFGPERKFRVAGLYRPDQSEFIFLGGCEKRQGVYIPADAFDEALRRMADFYAGRGDLVDHF